MRLIFFGLVGMCALAQGAGRNRDAEAAMALESFFEGSMSANQLSNRVSFLSAERFASDQLVDRLRKTADPKKRGQMLEVLSQIAAYSDDAEVVLMRALSDDVLGNRMAAAKALGRIKSAKAMPKLETLLGDSALGARRAAAQALGAIGKPKSGAALAAAAKIEEDVETRAVMLMAIGKTGDTKQTKALETYLESSSESARLAAVQALCLLGSPKGQAFAKKVLSSDDKLERLQGVRLFEGTSLKLAKPLLTPALDDEDHAVRAAAGRVLAQAGDESKVDWLVIQSAKQEKASVSLLYENELEKLRVDPERRAAILTKAGLK